MLKVLLKLYGLDVVLSLGWVGKMLVKEKIRDKSGLPSVFNDLYDDYLKYQLSNKTAIKITVDQAIS